MFTQLSITNPKARNPFKCIWCGGFIKRKEVHVKIVGIYDDDMQSNRLHTDCHSAYIEYFKTGDSDGFDPYSFKRGTTEDR
jgi:hypothetical protein